MEPVRVSGRSMADSWWVKAWNRNLENHSDYPNRLPRGRRYPRNGSVLDLRISEGRSGQRSRGAAAGPTVWMLGKGPWPKAGRGP